jgi:hypothetical protein
VSLLQAFASPAAHCLDCQLMHQHLVLGLVMVVLEALDH